MKGRLIVCLCIMAFLSIAFYGCSEKEECPSCPQSVQKATMFGQVRLIGSNLYFSGGILNIDASKPDVDMVTVAGHNIEMTEIAGDGVNYIMLIHNDLAGGITSGDNLDIQVHMPQGMCSCEIVVLNEPEDEPQIIGWSMSSPFDTVALNTEMEFDWHPVENAEWYLFSTYYYFGDGPGQQINNYYYTTDTSFTIPASMTTMNGRYSIYVDAVTGPRPDEIGGNITGGYVKGVINSNVDNNTNVIIGTGTYSPQGAPTINCPEFDFREAYEILKNQ